MSHQCVMLHGGSGESQAVIDHGFSSLEYNQTHCLSTWQSDPHCFMSWMPLRQ